MGVRGNRFAKATLGGEDASSKLVIYAKGLTEKVLIKDGGPVCDSPVARVEGEVIARCSNTSCPARFREAISHFASTEAMDIRGLGAKLADQLVGKQLVKNLADICALTMKDLKRLMRMAK